MSQAPCFGRATPRASVAGHVIALPASIAGLEVRRLTVGTEPPWLASEPRPIDADTVSSGAQLLSFVRLLEPVIGVGNPAELPELHPNAPAAPLTIELSRLNTTPSARIGPPVLPTNVLPTTCMVPPE